MKNTTISQKHIKQTRFNPTSSYIKKAIDDFISRGGKIKMLQFDPSSEASNVYGHLEADNFLME